MTEKCVKNALFMCQNLLAHPSRCILAYHALGLCLLNYLAINRMYHDSFPSPTIPND